MAWTRIDDKFLMNPKVQSAGAYGMALYLSGLIYCNSNLTDGFIPDVMLPVLCGLAFQTPNKKGADVLVSLNLWERVDGGYLIHDFLSFNRSRDEIIAINQKRTENGAKGGRPVKQMITEQKPGQVIFSNRDANQTITENKPINPNTLNPNTLNPEKIKTTATGGETLGAVVRVYESEIGVITASIADELKQAVSEYPDGWIEDALREAARQNKRMWSYARAILKRWKAEGRENGKARTQGGADLDKYRALYEQTKQAN